MKDLVEKITLDFKKFLKVKNEQKSLNYFCAFLPSDSDNVLIVCDGSKFLKFCIIL